MVGGPNRPNRARSTKPARRYLNPQLRQSSDGTQPFRAASCPPASRRYLDLLARGRLADVAHAAFYAEDDDARALAAAFVAEKRADLGGGDGASAPPDPTPRAAGPSL